MIKGLLGRIRGQRGRQISYKIEKKKGLYRLRISTEQGKAFEDLGSLCSLSEVSGVSEAELVDYIEYNAIGGIIEYKKEEDSVGGTHELATKREYLMQFLVRNSTRIVPYVTFVTRTGAEGFIRHIEMAGGAV